MRIGDVSRARRFSNPARLRWYAFHRSVRFSLRMMRTGQEPRETSPLEQLPCPGLVLGEDGHGEIHLPENVQPN
jgi:hypothetical protein